jgi:hypothetical protein
MEPNAEERGRATSPELLLRMQFPAPSSMGRREIRRTVKFAGGELNGATVSEATR